MPLRPSVTNWCRVHETASFCLVPWVIFVPPLPLLFFPLGQQEIPITEECGGKTECQCNAWKGKRSAAWQQLGSDDFSLWSCRRLFSWLASGPGQPAYNFKALGVCVPWTACPPRPSAGSWGVMGGNNRVNKTSTESFLKPSEFLLFFRHWYAVENCSLLLHWNCVIWVGYWLRSQL